MRNIIIGSVGKISVNGKEGFLHYRANAKHRNKENTYTSRDYRKIIKAFYGKIADALVENDGGVFIKNMGYFCVIRHPKKQVVKVQYLGGKEYFNSKTNNYLYSPMFFGFGKKKALYHFWVMDRAFSVQNVKKRVSKMLLSGKVYKTFISTLSSLYLFNKDN